MAWTYGGVRIFTEKDSGKIPNPRIDEVNPLATTETTYVHTAGRDSYTRSLTVVVWEGNWSSLLALVDGAEHALVSDAGAEGDWVIMNIKPKRIQALNKTDHPVVRVALDLMEVV